MQSPLQGRVIKILFSRRAPRPRFENHHDNATLLGSPPAHKEETFHATHHSSFCFYHGADVKTPKALNQCLAGRYAD